MAGGRRRHGGPGRSLSGRALAALNDYTVMVYRLFGVHATIRLPGIPAARNPWDPGRPLVCELIRHHPALGARCDASEGSIAAAAAAGMPALCRCHAGFWQLAIPLRRGSRTLGHVLCSPLRAGAEGAAAAARRVHAAVGDLKHERTTIRRPGFAWFVRQLPVLGVARRRALEGVTREFFDAFFRELEGGDLPRGFAFYHAPVRAAADGEAWVSYLWAGTAWEAEDPPGGRWQAERGRTLLLYANAGPVEVEVPGRTIRVPAGSCVLVPPGRRRRIRHGGERAPYAFWIWFVSGTDVSRLALAPFVPRGAARDLLEEIVRRSTADGMFAFRDEGKLKMLELLMELRRGGARAGRAAGRGARTRDAVLRARRYLEDHVAERVSLGDVARAAGMNRHGLCRRFTAETGRPPLAYHRSLKVERARVLLRDTDWPIKTVAARLGFSGLVHFHRVFRGASGLAPRAFRATAGPVNTR